jgi:hypothetical protein
MKVKLQQGGAAKQVQRSHIQMFAELRAASAGVRASKAAGEPLTRLLQASNKGLGQRAFAMFNYLNMFGILTCVLERWDQLKAAPVAHCNGCYQTAEAQHRRHQEPSAAVCHCSARA